MIRLIKFEWKYTYQSCRRDGWSRRYSTKRFLREVFVGLIR